MGLVMILQPPPQFTCRSVLQLIASMASPFMVDRKHTPIKLARPLDTADHAFHLNK